ncbi:MAG: TraM recognition domain-containing protein [Phycisphaerales bacterium]
MYNHERVERVHAPELLESGVNLGLGIDYRSEDSPDYLVRSLLTTKFLAVPFVVLAVTFAARLLSPWTASSFALGVFTLISVGVAMKRAAFPTELRELGPQPVARFLLTAALGPLAWLLIVFSTLLDTPLLAAGMPFLVAVCAAVYLADAVANHYLAWTAASPRVPDERRQRWLWIWRTRWQSGSDPTELGGLRHRYLIRLGFVAIAYFAAIAAMRLIPIGLSGHVLSGTLAILTFCGLLALASPDPRRCNPRAVMRAIASYLTAIPSRDQAPGVFRSPAGPVGRRFNTLFLVLAVLTFSIPAMSLYFPIGIMTAGPGPWSEAAQRVDWVVSLPERVQDTPADTRPSRARVRDSLSDAQLAYLNALPSETARNAYLDDFRGGEQDARDAYLVANYVTRTPETWLVLAVVGLTTLEPVFIWSLLVSFILSITVPLAVLFLVVYAVAGEPICTFEQTFEGPNASRSRPSDEPEWREYARRLQSSPSPIVRDHLWLGTSKYGDHPILLHRQALDEHAHILGDTGSGKTSRGLAPLVSQLIATAPATGSYPGHSVIVIDLKGEPYFFNSTRVDARAAGVPFRWFTSVTGQPTYVFNPFLQSHVKGLSTHQFAEVLLQSLGLEYGEAYGPSHYSRMNRRVLQRAMQVHASGGTGELESFRELEQVLQTGQTGFTADEKRDATDVFAVIESLARIDAINVTQKDVAKGRVSQTAVDNAIDMTAFLTDPQVGYFYFSSTLETSTVRELAKLALFSLLTAADALERTRGPGHRVYVVIDEFQQIIASNLELVLRQARSKNISCILSNQSISDLKSGGIDVTATVQANTRVRQYFAASDIGQQDLIQRSGGEVFLHEAEVGYAIEELDFDRGPLSEVPPQTVLAGQIGYDEIISMTDDPDMCVLHVTRGSGLTQFSGYPILMRTDYHVSKRRFDRWKAKPWPRNRPETIVAPSPDDLAKRARSPFIDGDDPGVSNELKSNTRIAEALAERKRQQQKQATTKKTTKKKSGKKRNKKKP